jgi:type II secretory pathway pseudopilin PulG
MFVIAIMGVMAGVAVGALSRMTKDSKADSSLVAVVNQLRVARDLAIGQRRNYRLTFVDPNKIEIYRAEITPTNTFTLVSELYLTGNLKFQTYTSVPDTPDAFGKTTATNFPSTSRFFTSEGTFVDGNGDPMNGSIFVGVPEDPSSARAITIMGATALIHPWRWNGARWVD